MFSAELAFKGLANLIYPLYCQVCKSKLDPANTRYLCENCWSKIKKSRAVPASGHNYFFHSLWSIGRYQGVLKDCIRLFKYNKKSFMAKPLGELMNNFIAGHLDRRAIGLIVPVPLHSSKLRERGFNQSLELAVQISKRSSLPLSSSSLYRKRPTISQTELSKQERLINVKAAFAVKNSLVLKKQVLLVDDVFTSGATANECSKTLLEAGACAVSVLTLARGN
ncbi:MAG: ComF family protein [Candidatus Omnitrophota bacterium]|nr:ComF family protein [Candidatus Omnitrophota bacterium]